MSFGQLIGDLPDDQRRLIRRIESFAEKLNNAAVAVAFNKVCLQENLFPGYTNLRLHDEGARNADFT